MVPVSEVVGRAVVIAWPLGRWDMLEVPDTFDQPALGTQASVSSALTSAPQGVALVGAVPLVLWRRRWDRRREEGTRA